MPLLKTALAFANLGKVVKRFSIDFFDPAQPRDGRGRFASKASSSTTAVSKTDSSASARPQFAVVTDRRKLKQGFEDWKPVLEILEGSANQEIGEKIKFLSTKRADQQSRMDKLSEPKDHRALKLAEGKEVYGDSFDPSEETLQKLIQRSIDATNDRIKKVQAEIDSIDTEITTLQDKRRKAIESEAAYGLQGLDEDRRNAVIEIVSNFETLLSMPNAKVAGVVDANGNLQSLINYSKGKDHVYIDFLASAPWGIIPNHEKAVKGAGSAAIEAAIRMSQEQGKQGKLKLMALRNAVPFYEKVGFVQTDDDADVPEMMLSAQKAEEFLARSRR